MGVGHGFEAVGALGSEQFPPMRVMVYLLSWGEEVDMRLFVVPPKRLAKPLGLDRGWGRKAKENTEGPKVSGMGPSVADFYRPFQGGHKLQAHETPQGLKKPPWQIRHEFLEEEREKEREKRRQALREGRPVYRPGYSPGNTNQINLNEGQNTSREGMKIEGRPLISSGERQNARATGGKSNFKTELSHLAPAFTPSSGGDSEKFMDTSTWHATNFQHNDSSWTNSTKSIGPSFAGRKGCGAGDANCVSRQVVSRVNTWQRFEERGDSTYSFDQGQKRTSEFNDENMNRLDSSGARGRGRNFRSDHHQARKREFRANTDGRSFSFSKTQDPHTQSSGVQGIETPLAKKNCWKRVPQPLTEEDWKDYEQTPERSHTLHFDQQAIVYDEMDQNGQQHQKQFHSADHGPRKGRPIDSQRDLSGQSSVQTSDGRPKYPPEKWLKDQSDYSYSSNLHPKGVQGSGRADQMGKAQKQMESIHNNTYQEPSVDRDRPRFKQGVDNLHGTPLPKHNSLQTGRRSIPCDKHPRSCQGRDQKALFTPNSHYSEVNRNSMRANRGANENSLQISRSRGRGGDMKEGTYKGNRPFPGSGDESSIRRRASEGFGRPLGTQGRTGARTFQNSRWNARDNGDQAYKSRDVRNLDKEEIHYQRYKKPENLPLGRTASLKVSGPKLIGPNEDWNWDSFEKRTCPSAPPSSSNGAKPYTENSVLVGDIKTDKGHHNLETALYGGGHKLVRTKYPHESNHKRDFEDTNVQVGWTHAVSKPSLCYTAESRAQSTEMHRCQDTISLGQELQTFRSELPKKKRESNKQQTQWKEQAHPNKIRQVAEVQLQMPQPERPSAADMAIGKTCAEEGAYELSCAARNSARNLQTAFHTAWDGGPVQRRAIADIFARAVQDATEEGRSRTRNSSNSYDVNSRSEAGSQDQPPLHIRGIPHNRDRKRPQRDAGPETRNIHQVHVKSERGIMSVFKPDFLSDSNSVPVGIRQKPRPDSHQ